MGSLSKTFNRLLHGLIAVCLSFMALFVFANVILRYFFNSGLTWAEEASRYLFIWLIFLGAIVAYRENAHLGVDTLVQRLSIRGKKVLFIVNNVLIVVTMALVAQGTFELTLLTMDQRSPSMDMPLAYVYVSGLIASVSMVAIGVANLYKALAKKIDADQLVMITDSEDQEFIEKVVSAPQEEEKK